MAARLGRRFRPKHKPPPERGLCMTSRERSGQVGAVGFELVPKAAAGSSVFPRSPAFSGSFGHSAAAKLQPFFDPRYNQVGTFGQSQLLRRRSDERHQGRSDAGGKPPAPKHSCNPFRWPTRAIKAQNMLVFTSNIPIAIPATSGRIDTYYSSRAQGSADIVFTFITHGLNWSSWN